MNDTRLLQSFVQEHRQDAFEALVLRYLPLVRGVAWRVMGDATSVDDIAMRVFAVLAKKAARLEGHAALGSWLVVATRQEALKWRRSEQRRRHTLHRYEANIVVDELEPSEAFLREEIDAALALLDEKDRQVILLRYYEEMSYPEIGAVLGRGEDAARKRCAAALKQLASCLARLAPGPSFAALGVSLAKIFHGTPLNAQATASSAAALAETAWQRAAAVSGGLSLGSLGLSLVALFVSWLAGWGGSQFWPGKVSPSSSLAQHGHAANTLSSPVATRTSKVPGFSLDGKSAVAIAQELVRRYDNKLAFNRGEAAVEPPPWTALINEIAVEQVASIIEAVEKNYSANRKRRSALTNSLMDHWGKQEPEAACRYASRRWKTDIWELDELRGVLWNPLQQWGSRDPLAALQWVQQQSFPTASYTGFEHRVLEGMGQAQPHQLLTVLTQLPEPQLADFLIYSDLTEEFLAATRSQLVALPDTNLRSQIACSLPLPESLEQQQSLHRDLQLGNTDASWQFIRNSLKQMEPETQPKTLEWAWQTAPKAARPSLSRDWILPWHAKDPAAASQWLEQQSISLETLIQHAAVLDSPDSP